ncbi:DNA gyrase subunit A [Rhizobium sp. MHM7A]|uniref:DNA gyrase subunit A n=1 Tax=Rhizobium sp. MHM7A TaxID=2583233 RepID=UPI00110681D5|nr:DNA gyrase subunit A [Rhizobium sp. MHM7A]TLX17001.1 DNA gyrase subunit A [Rhizobium sp. MHM7A]
MGIENQFSPEDHEPSAVAAVTDGKTIFMEDEMKKSFLDYAMSVIVARALPDVRDGLKPVHRRIIYSMFEKGNTASKPYEKCAKTVGNVIGNYHPHGDQAVYSSLVRLAQDWVQRHPIIDGQGNFGNRDGDPPAAYRYTEARLHRLAERLVTDLRKGTVEFIPTFDNKEMEPRLLPARWPNLIVNGQIGIAVGMATEIPSHNLSEAIDACFLIMDNPNATVDDIMQVMPGPDFSTAGVIMGQGGIRQAYETGRGSIRVAGRWDIVETKGGKTQIIITEMPWGTNATNTVKKINEMRKVADKLRQTNKEYDKVLDGIAEVVDETAEDLRIVVEVKRDADPNIVLNFLKKKTDLVTTFSYNSTVLGSNGQPSVMSMAEMIREFVAFRRQTVRKRTIFELNEARETLTYTIGLYAAVSQVDLVVNTIKTSSDQSIAQARLQEIDFPTEGELAELLFAADPDFEVDPNYRLTAEQAKHVLEMSLGRLTGMETSKIADNARDLVKQIEFHNSVLNERSILDGIVRNEMQEIKDRFHSPRMTEIQPYDADEIDDEDLIEHKDIVVTLSNSGYVKRTELGAYREQKRGGKGRSGMETKEDDFIQTALHCSTKSTLLLFTSRGIAHTLKAFQLPEGNPSYKGRPIVNFINLLSDETITNVIVMPRDPEEIAELSLLFVTDFGDIRRNSATDFAKVNKNGKIAIKLEGDNGEPLGKLVKVLLAGNTDDVLISTEEGNCCRFLVDDLRVFNSRASTGVRAIKLARAGDKRSDGSILEKDDAVNDASVVSNFPLTPQERDAYQAGGTHTSKNADGVEETTTLTQERMAEMAAGEELLITVSAKGFGKRSSAYEYRRTSRGGVGTKAANINPETGALVACFPVQESDGLVMITDGGQMIRTRVSEVPVYGRATRGVRMFRLAADQKIVSVFRVNGDEVADEEPAATA